MPTILAEIELIHYPGRSAVVRGGGGGVDFGHRCAEVLGVAKIFLGRGFGYGFDDGFLGAV